MRMAMIAVIFRLAILADISSIYALDHIAAQGNEGRREFIRHAIQERNCIVATWNDKIAGYAVLEYTFFGCGFISMVYVHSDYRRQQIGHGLIEYLEQICKTPKLFTSTNLSNLPMQALLGRQGYVISGEIQNLDEGDPELVYFKAVRF